MSDSMDKANIHTGPSFAYEEAKIRIAELKAELSALREVLQELYDIMLMGGFDCSEMWRAKELLQEKGE